MLIGPRLTAGHFAPRKAAAAPLPAAAAIDETLPSITSLALELADATQEVRCPLGPQTDKPGLTRAVQAGASMVSLAPVGPAAVALNAQQAEFRGGACPYLASQGLTPESMSKFEFAAAVARNFDNPVQVFEAVHDKGAVVQVELPLAGTLLFDARPESTQQVLIATENNHGSSFEKSSLQSHGLAKLFGRDNIFLNNGQDWKTTRQALEPYFSGNALHTDEKTASIAAVVDRHLDALDEQLGVGGKVRVDLQARLEKLTLDVAMTHLFGANLDGPALDELNDAFAAVKRSVATETLLPGRVSRASLPGGKELRQAYATLEGWADRLLAARRQAGVGQRDALDGLLSARDPQTDKPFSDQRLRHEVLTLMLAGHETTASMISWSLCELARDPRRQSEVRDEIAQTVGESVPDFKELKALRGVASAWRQSITEHPPSYFIARQALEDTRLGPAGQEVSVKKGTTVLLSTRHANQSKKMFSFGGGGRLCLGQLMARMEAEMAITRVLQRFELAADGALSTASQVSAHPADATVELTRRSSHHLGSWRLAS
ncbi:MAG: cytochrome P450 [Vulcanimicrobiota bacterium]